MSKNRPSTLSGFAAAEANSVSRGQADLEYWYQRLFKNTFTYKGTAIQTRRWCVKIQFQGRRKTLSLSSLDRSAAAAEALDIYSRLLSGGWEAVLSPARTKPQSPFGPSRAEADSDQRTHPSFWKPRLVVRKYTEALGPKLQRELSVRIEHGEASQYFPLGTEHTDAGALRALEIYQTVIQHGWEQAKLNYPRELTLGILWATNPFACTYATLYTIPANQPGLFAEATENPRPASLWVIDADRGIARALAFWVRHGTPIQRVRAVETPQNALRELHSETPTLVLANQDMSGTRELLDQLRERKLMAFMYGVFENSDDIFASVTGVSRGYMLRRRPPNLLLEPVARTLQSANPSAEEASRQIKLHFQHLFDPSMKGEDAQNPISLTRREQEILDFLSKGYLDKEIATNLGISAWTVHSHLKRIYEKLGVHTRTEAVVRYLQK